MAEEFKVTPWEVTGDIDYDRLQQQFGTTPVDDVVATGDETDLGMWSLLLAGSLAVMIGAATLKRKESR